MIGRASLISYSFERSSAAHSKTEATNTEVGIDFTMAAKKSKKSKKVAEAPPEEEVPKKEPAAPAAESSKKKKKKKSKKSKKEPTPPPPPPVESGSEDDDAGSEEQEEEGDDMRLTLEALDAISDDDSNENEDDNGSGEEDGEDGGEYDAEALALRKMIQDGKFDSLLKNHAKKSKKDDGEKKKKAAKEESESESESEPEEVELDASMEEDDAVNKEEGNDDDDDDDSKDNKEEQEDDSSSDSDEEKEGQVAALAAQQKSINSTRALALETALQAADRHLPWAETFAIVPLTPLPFGPLPNSVDAAAASSSKKRQRTEDEDNEEEEEYVDVHDDLKREVAFYDNALESVLLAREKCEEVGIPFARPEDFFAEMVKSDDHMAKIKDRLIFETKKMEAVERRKSNKEQTLMAKERHAHRLAEKAKAKKAHMSAVEDWKKNAERGRGSLGGKVRDWQDDEDQLRGMGGGKGGLNKKRAAADKRYGFGGKRGRFKQNDAKTLNDMSGYNPRGGFGGVGQKGGGGGKKKGGGGGNKRPGKRARDAARTR